jgi:hypothetical protein
MGIKNDRRLNETVLTGELNGAISESYRFEYKTKKIVQYSFEFKNSNYRN